MANDTEIVFVSSEFPPQPGGIGHHGWSFCTKLRDLGLQVDVVTNSRASQDENFEKKFDQSCSFNIHRVKRFNLSILTYIFRIIITWKLLKGKQPKVVIASGKFSIWLVGLLSYVYVKNRYYSVLHGSELTLNGWSKVLIKHFLLRFEKFIAVSKFTKSLAISLQPKINIVVIPNGFDQKRLDRYIHKAALQGFPSIVTVGNVTKRKGQHNVINAMKNVLEEFPEAHYHIIGLPTEVNSLKALAVENKVENNITFHGALPDEKMIACIRGSNVFAMLSERQSDGDVEGFGIAILEANYLGLPAIGSLETGIEDAISNGISGYLIKPQNSRDFIHSLKEIMNNYQIYSKNAYDWSLHFTWDRVILDYIEELNLNVTIKA